MSNPIFSGSRVEKMYKKHNVQKINVTKKLTPPKLKTEPARKRVGKRILTAEEFDVMVDRKAMIKINKDARIEIMLKYMNKNKISKQEADDLIANDTDIQGELDKMVTKYYPIYRDDVFDQEIIKKKKANERLLKEKRHKKGKKKPLPFQLIQ